MFRSFFLLTCGLRCEVAFLKVMFRNASVQELADGHNAGADVVKEVANLDSGPPSGRGASEALGESGNYFSASQSKLTRLLLVWECVKRTGCSGACGAVAASKLGVWEWRSALCACPRNSGAVPSQLGPLPSSQRLG